MNLKPKSLYKNHKVNYGVVIMFIAGLSYFFSAPGQTFFISGFIDIYVNELGFSRTTVSTLYSVATLMSGFLIFSVGHIADKVGTKKTMIVVGVLLGVVCFFNSFNFNLITLFIGFFFSRFFGQGSMTLLPALVLPKWFIKKRAMSFSIMSIGGVIGSTLIPVINAALFNIISWRNVFRIWGILIWIIFTPKQAMRTFAFWGMLYCQIILPFITTGITFHFISIMQSKDLTKSNAAMILSLFAMISFPVTLLAGKIMDGIKQHYVAVFISVLELIALVILLMTNNILFAIIFALFHGTATGIQAVNNGVVWANYFGTLYLGSIRGISMIGTVISSAIGPIPFGVLYSVFGNYDFAIISIMVLPILGIIIAGFSKKPEKIVLNQ